MKIGELVKAYIEKIFDYCDTVDHEELTRLMDKAYSKKTFGIYFPFCTEVSLIPQERSGRYWEPTYMVRGKTVRVCSQWYSGDRPLFMQYLLTKNIATEDELEKMPEMIKAGGQSRANGNRTRSRRSNSRYNGNAIGNTQNRELRMNIKNRVDEFEFDIGSILAQLSYHIHPRIVEYIQSRNNEEYGDFKTLFNNRVEIAHYLFDGSACVFPGVRRYVAGQGKRGSYNQNYRAIIDDNTFPRHIWCFLSNGKTYSSPNWRETGLSEFELAHIFTHKESEIETEEALFDSIQSDLYPYSNFTCACNVVLLPKGMVRPTDNSRVIKAAFYQRYIDLYGEEPLIGRSGFRKSLVPDWYSELKWNDPPLPSDWRENTDRLLKYRTKRVTHLLTDKTE